MTDNFCKYCCYLLPNHDAECAIAAAPRQEAKPVAAAAYLVTSESIRYWTTVRELRTAEEIQEDHHDAGIVDTIITPLAATAQEQAPADKDATPLRWISDTDFKWLEKFSDVGIVQIHLLNKGGGKRVPLYVAPAVDEDAARHRYCIQRGEWPLCMQQVHPTVGEQYWKWDGEDQRYPTANAAIDAALQSQPQQVANE